MVYPAKFIEKSCGGNPLVFDYGADPSVPADTYAMPFAMEVTAEEVRDGADIQGLKWNNATETREEIRGKRLKTYDDRDDDSQSSEEDVGSESEDDQEGTNAESEDDQERTDAESEDDQEGTDAESEDDLDVTDAKNGDDFFRNDDSESGKEEDEEETETREEIRGKRLKTYDDRDDDSESSEEDVGSENDQEGTDAESEDDQEGTNAESEDDQERTDAESEDDQEGTDAESEDDLEVTDAKNGDDFFRSDDSESGKEEDEEETADDKAEEEQDIQTNEDVDRETDEEDEKGDDSENEDDDDEEEADCTILLVMTISDNENGEDDSEDEEDDSEDEEDDNEDEEDDNEDEEDDSEDEEDDSDDGVKDIQRVEIRGEFYEFFLNTRHVQPAKTHGQLSDLVWATSRDEVYVLSEPSVVSRWSATDRNVTEVVRAESFNSPTPVITTFAVNETTWVGGGFKGELMWKRLNRDGVNSFEKITDAEDAIITSIQLHDRTRSCIVSSNDKFIRIYDTDNFQLQNSVSVPFAVNAASLAPNRDIFLAGGDRSVGILGDLKSQKKIADIQFEGFCNAVAWHPNGEVFATCTEDEKCQLWDARNTRHPFKDLIMLWGSATSVLFSADGEFLVVGEPDFVNLYSSSDNYVTRQQIDFFGGLSGMSLSPDDESLFIGITDHKSVLSSLMIYHRLPQD